MYSVSRPLITLLLQTAERSLFTLSFVVHDVTNGLLMILNQQTSLENYHAEKPNQCRVKVNNYCLNWQSTIVDLLKYNLLVNKHDLAIIHAL